MGVRSTTMVNLVAESVSKGAGTKGMRIAWGSIGELDSRNLAGSSARILDASKLLDNIFT